LTLEEGQHAALVGAAGAGRRIVAVGFAMQEGKVPQTIHSFRITRVTPTDQPFIDAAASSKNTFGHFDRDTTVKGQLTMYAKIGAIRFLKSKS
jgi:hypothetical protein